MDWERLTFAGVHHLPIVLAIGAVVALGAFILGRRHARSARFGAGALRLVALAALGIALMAPVITVQSQDQFKPKGTWVLALSELDLGEFYADAFAEDADTFVARVRAALAEGNPPEQTIVVGFGDEAVEARDRILALGVPCRAVIPADESSPRRPVLTGIDAPLSVRPDEALEIKPRVAGEGGTVKVYVDGDELVPEDGRYILRTDEPGAHVVESVLLDDTGHELQRRGHVFRVGDRPSVLALGLDDEQLDRAIELAPDYVFTRADAENLHGSDLEDIDLVITSVETLYGMGENANELAMFVARGGGLYITGDGAKYVAPEYMNDDVRRLLPVLLKKEGRKPPDEDPPIEEIEGEAEIAKVSLFFVLDRSISMDQLVGSAGRPGSASRWQIATKGVVESIKLVHKGGKRGEEGPSEAIGTHIGVMSFTLSQDWVRKPGTILPGDVKYIENDLKQLKGDREVDAQFYNTDIYAAMDAAIDRMIDEPSAVKVIVMLTDGGDRPANTVEGKHHATLRERARKNDINIVSVGIGNEFAGNSTESLAARKVIKELATKPGFAHIPADAEAAKEAYVIFVDSVETAFQAYDDKKKKEEEERQKRLEELKNKEEEPPKVEVMPGTFPLVAETVGRQIFGEDVLPEPAPKLAWLARNEARNGTAVALSADTELDGITPALAFRGYGLGRVAFWGAGTDPEDLGELTGWGDFPGIFAASLRWLLPREQPDVRLVGEGTPEGVRILDPIEGASYSFKTAFREIALKRRDDMFVPAEGELPLGSGEIIEKVGAGDGPSTGSGEGAEQRRIGDVYIANEPPESAAPRAMDVAPELPPLKARPPEVIEQRHPATPLILYLLTGFFILMPFERIIRRRS